MNNKHLTFAALAAATLATSCTSDDLAGQKQSQTGSQTVTLTASVDDKNTTRMGMSKGDNSLTSFYWNQKDIILVQVQSDETISGARFATTAEDGATTASFTGDVVGTVGKFAVYPYSESHKFTSETALTYNLPATYTYEKVESNIFSKTTNGVTSYPTNNTSIPLVGKIEDGNIVFKHIGGLAVIRIDKMPVSSGTLKITANEQLSGDFSIADLSVSEPVITTTTSSDNNTVTFSFSNASTESAGVFYLPLATGSYSGMKIEIASNDNTTSSTINYGTLDVVRASVTAIPLYNNSGTIEKYVKDSDGKYIINGHKFVDLGLSVLWAETNIGASSETDYGNYYAWGEVTAYNENTDWGDKSVKTKYESGTYKHGTGTSIKKYNSNDKKTVLDKEDDAAYVNGGSSCRMPTNAEIQELVNSDNCTWTWDSDKKGYKVTSKKSGYESNSIFLPASGYRSGNYFYNDGSNGDYWSSSRNSSNLDCAYYLFFKSDSQKSDYDYRYDGRTVRPVAEK